MTSQTKCTLSKLAIVLGFVLIAVLNYLSTSGQINGISVSAVSNKYPSLFTPEPYTFSIWGIIYLLLLTYILFQLMSNELRQKGTPSKIAFFFVLSCVLNAGWIFVWHYELILVSALVMAALMACLARILLLVSTPATSFGSVISLEIPFGLYAGWITVATVGNIASLLANATWNRLGIPDPIWLIVTLLVAAAIAVWVSQRVKNAAYPAAVIWGFTGILVRYVREAQMNAGDYTGAVIAAIAICILALSAQWIHTLIRRVRPL